MKKTVLASAVLLAMAGAASATPDFGTITIDGKTADSSALATETNGIVKIEGTSEKEAFKEALQKPLFPSRIEQNRSVRFFFTTSKNGVFLPSK